MHNCILSCNLESISSQHYDLYLVVNGGGHTDAEISADRAIFYEHDDLSKEIQAQLWETLKLPQPTFQIDTGGKSIHSYWVFEKPIPIEQWKELQTDLLEYADADRSIKNPSRVMRLAGTLHQKTQKQSLIISSIGHRYSFEELRAILLRRRYANVPITATSGSANDVTDVTVTPTATTSTAASRSESTGASTQKSATTFCIPLENCLTKEHRDFIAMGVSEGGRNNSGAALARDLIGTANRLDYLGIEYSGSPRQLLDEFASCCIPPLPERE